MTNIKLLRFFYKKIHFVQNYISIRYRRKFVKKLKNCKKVQEKLLLKNIVKRNKKTGYGVEYDFKKIKSIEDYKQKVPIVTYEEIRKYVELIENGQKNVLTRDKVVFFGTTSGTTNSAKLIPVTKKVIKKQQIAWKIWSNNIFRKYPEIYVSPHCFLSFTSGTYEGTTKSGIIYGSISGLLHDIQPKPLKLLYTVPDEIYGIKDYKLKYYLCVLFSLRYNVQKLITPNPSMYLFIAEILKKHFKDFIYDYESNTIQKLFETDSLSQELKDKILHKFTKHKKLNTKTYKKLVNLYSQKRSIIPADVYPNLKVINCWMDGSVKIYLEKVKELYGKHVEFFEIGLLATEGRFSTPLAKDILVLSIDYGFYEFIELKEYEKHGLKSRTLLAHELKVGERYYIIISAENGLYRYFMDDIIEVPGFIGSTPRIKFVQKGKYFSSITGEKISEWEVIDALEKSKKKLTFDYETFFVVPNTEKLPPHYEYYIELKSKPKGFSEDKLSTFLDEILMEENQEYKQKRKSMRLNKLRVFLLKEGSTLKIRDSFSKDIRNHSQVKVPKLITLEKDKIKLREYLHN